MPAVSSAAAAEPASTGGTPKEAETTPAGVDTVPDTGPWTAAVSRIRDTSTWVMNAFIAVGAVIVGSGPLVGKLTGISGWSWVWVCVGMLIAVIGVAAVILAASNVMLPVYVSDVDLADGHGSPVELDAKRKALTARRWEQTDTTAANEFAALAAAAGSAKERTEMERFAARNNETAAAWRRVGDEWVMLLSYIRIRDQFHASRRGMFVGAALVIVGVGVYLAAVGGVPSTDKTSEAAASTATETGSGTAAGTAAATVRVFTWMDDAGPFRAAVGLNDDTCKTITVQVHDGTGTDTDPWDVTSMPGAGCTESVRFLVTSEQGVVSDPTPVIDQPDDLTPGTDTGSVWSTIWSVLIGIVVFVAVLAVVVIGVVSTLLWFNKKYDWGLVEPDTDQTPTDRHVSAVSDRSSG